MATKETEELYVEEGQDGSATVELPENLLPNEENDEPQQQNASDDGDDDHPDDSEAVRAARRARRRSKKDLIRKTNEEKDVRLQMLQRENEELRGRMSKVERMAQEQGISRIDKAIEDQNVRLEYAKMKLAEATASGDGESAVQAQELLYEARQNLSQLAQNKRQASQQEPEQRRIDPGVQRHAANWIERNEWYKPDLSNTDSKIAKQVDESLVADGWNPGTAEYWDELDNRLQKYLPHQYNSKQEKGSTRSPRNTVGSSGREASAAFGGTNRTFTLSAEQVRAMKDAAMWDDPVKRAKMIKRYAADARTNNRGN